MINMNFTEQIEISMYEECIHKILIESRNDAEIISNIHKRVRL